MEETATNTSVYMSEREVQNIIDSFRTGLSIYTNEIEKFQNSNENLHGELQGELAKGNGLQEELKSLQLLSQEKTTILESYQEKITLIEAGLSKLVSFHSDSGDLKSRLTHALQAKDKEQIKKNFDHLLEKIKTLESENERMRRTNEELQMDLDRLNSGEKACTMCLHCKREFIPKQNKEGDCVYHSGKLKYYSCKGCGDDAYYNCCNKCSKCSEGCRRGKHVPI
jgi:chromosome segregation ATPase